MRLNKWKYLFKAYFNYTVKEQRAIIVLMIVISFLQIALIALHWVPVNGKSRNDLPSQVIDSTYRSNVDTSISAKGNSKTNSSSIKLFLFNPNTNKMNDWMKLGLTEKQSLSIL